MTHADTTRRTGDAQELLGEVASLRRELATLREELDSVRRERPSVAPDPAVAALRRQQAAWDLVLGLTPEVRQRRAEAAQRRSTFEDAGVRFITQHSGKIWLLLLMLAVFVVTFRDRLV